MIPAILLFFFIPALLTTPTHPCVDGVKVPVYSTLLPDIFEIDKAVTHIVRHVHKYGILRVYSESEQNKQGRYFQRDDVWQGELNYWMKYNNLYDHQLGYCYNYSFYIAEQLTKFGYKAVVVGNRIHAVVEVWTVGGIVIVDATYRQFFPYNKNPNLFKAWGMPEVLIAYREDFRFLLYSFPIQPSFGDPLAPLIDKDGILCRFPILGYTGAYGSLVGNSMERFSLSLSKKYLWQMIHYDMPNTGLFMEQKFNEEGGVSRLTFNQQHKEPHR